VPITDPPARPVLRIALICPYSLSRPGGVQGQVVGLSRALGSRGHQVTVFAPLDGAGPAPEGVDLVATGHSVSLPANGSFAPVTLSVRAVLRALRSLRSTGFDVLHVHEPFAPGLSYGLLVGRRLPPVVATFHRSGSSVLYELLGPLARNRANRLAVRCAVSEAARATAAGALGGTYEVLFNGVEMEHYRSIEPWPTDRPTLLFLGRHEERKGLGVLVEAFEGLLRLRRDDPAVDGSVQPVLWIAGDGPQTDSLRLRYPESADIRWLGVLSEDEKIRRLVAADVLCAPSLGGESFGMVLLEAMAARTVVVASDIDGYRDVAGDHAVLVPPGDPVALAEAVDGTLSGRLAPQEGGPGADTGDPAASRNRWLDAAEERAEQWSMDRLAERYEGIYLSVVGGRG
jgi:phosphatidylinositol alpha-mannosyltransferase